MSAGNEASAAKAVGKTEATSGQQLGQQQQQQQQQQGQQGLQKVESALKGRRELLDHRLFEMRHFDSGEYFCLPRDQQEDYLQDIETTEVVGHHHVHSARGTKPQQVKVKHRLEETNLRKKNLDAAKRTPVSAASATTASSAESASSPVADEATSSSPSSKFPFSPPRGTVASKHSATTTDVDTKHDGRRVLLERSLRRVRRFDSGDFFAGAPPDEAIAGTSPPRLRVMRTRALHVETKRKAFASASPSSSFSSSSASASKRAPNVQQGTNGATPSAGSEGRLKRNVSASAHELVECETPPEEAANKPVAEKKPASKQGSLQAADRIEPQPHRFRKKQQHPRFDSADFFRGALTDAAAIARVKDAPPSVQERADDAVTDEARRVVLERSMRRARRFDSADFFAGVPAEEDVVARSPPKQTKNQLVQNALSAPPPPAVTPGEQQATPLSSAKMAQHVLHRRMQRQDSSEAAKRKARQRIVAKMEGVAGRHGSVESKTSDDGHCAPAEGITAGSSRSSSLRHGSNLRHASSLSSKTSSNSSLQNKSQSAAAAAKERLRAPHSPRVHRFDSADYFRGIDTDAFALQPDTLTSITAASSSDAPSSSSSSARSPPAQAPYSPPIQSPPPGPSRLRKTSFERSAAFANRSSSHNS